MADTAFHFRVFLLCLVFFSGVTGNSARADKAHGQASRDSSGSAFDIMHELYLNQTSNESSGSGTGASGGIWKSVPNDRFFKYYIYDCYRLIVDMIRNPFAHTRTVSDRGSSKAGHDHNVLFVFGDSVFDGGNNKYINDDTYAPSNYPYGYTYFNNATGRASDGRLVPDFIAEYANLPPIPPSLQPGADFSYGANFASEGAAVLDSDGLTTINVINLQEQVLQFKEMVGKFNETLGPQRTREMLRKAVYLFSIGGVDDGHYYDETIGEGLIPTQAEREQFVKYIVGNTTNALIDIYEHGGRKIAFQSIAPLGCLPLFGADSNGSCVQFLLSVPKLHNEKLYRALTGLAERLEGFKFSVMDYFTSLYNRIVDPTDNGFEFGNTPCLTSEEGVGYRGYKGSAGNYTLCEYPSAYVLFDEGHATQRANEQIAKLVWGGDPSVTRPYNVKQLFEDF